MAALAALLESGERPNAVGIVKRPGPGLRWMVLPPLSDTDVYVVLAAS